MEERVHPPGSFQPLWVAEWEGGGWYYRPVADGKTSPWKLKGCGTVNVVWFAPKKNNVSLTESH